MLILSGVYTEYDGVPMLREVSLAIGGQRLVCLLGSNGAGKTTTVKAIMGLVKPVKGEIQFEGKSIGHLKTNQIVERGIAVVPEGRRLFPKMTVFENLRLGAYLVKDLRDAEGRFERVFHLFPVLKERMNQTAGTLSGGEQSMVSIGRGIMSGPKLLLLDEPSLGLAPKLVQEFFATIDRINKEERIAILLIEQNARKALTIADSGYLLQKGHIITGGSAGDLMENDVVKKAYLGEAE